MTEEKKELEDILKPQVKPKRIEMAESTKSVLEEEVGEEIDELSEEETLKKINESKKVVATTTTEGTIKVRQSLNG